MGFPDVPDPLPAPPPPPTPIDPSIQLRRNRERSLASGRRGRASTLLTGPGGISGSGALSRPTLLGGSQTADTGS